MSYFELFMGLPFLLSSFKPSSRLGSSEGTLFLQLMFPVGSGLPAFQLLSPPTLLLMGVLLGVVKAPLGVHLADTVALNLLKIGQLTMHGPLAHTLYRHHLSFVSPQPRGRCSDSTHVVDAKGELVKAGCELRKPMSQAFTLTTKLHSQMRSQC